jgi:hypothetical protein
LATEQGGAGAVDAQRGQRAEAEDHVGEGEGDQRRQGVVRRGGESDFHVAGIIARSMRSGETLSVVRALPARQVHGIDPRRGDPASPPCP